VVHRVGAGGSTTSQVFTVTVTNQVAFSSPSSLSGWNAMVCFVESGTSPFSSSGYFIFYPRGSGYQITGEQFNSSGDFIYDKIGATTARILFSGNVVGQGNVQTLTFTNRFSGSYETTNEITKAYQTGFFILEL
jgi:hypothetical protein